MRDRRDPAGESRRPGGRAADRRDQRRESTSGGELWIGGLHEIEVVLESQSRSIFELLVADGRDPAVLARLRALAEERGVTLSAAPRAELDRRFGGVHNGVVARVGAREGWTLDALLRAEPAGHRKILVLDGVEDPRNFGAILRVAEGFGATGVVIPKDRAASVTAAAMKSSAGASETARIATVVNLRAALVRLRDDGFWIWGAEKGGKAVHEIDLTGDVALVLGGEGKGLHRLVRETCDGLVGIPVSGRVESLNVATAAAVLLYEVRRQSGFFSASEDSRHGS